MKSKVISVRIDESLLEYLPAMSRDCRCSSRSYLINAALRVAVEYKKESGKWLGLGFYPEYGDVIDKLEFEYHREHK